MCLAQGPQGSDPREKKIKIKSSVQFLNNTLHYSTDLDITQSCCFLFYLILYIPVNNFFCYVGTGLPRLNQ